MFNQINIQDIYIPQRHTGFFVVLFGTHITKYKTLQCLKKYFNSSKTRSYKYIHMYVQYMYIIRCGAQSIQYYLEKLRRC